MACYICFQKPVKAMKCAGSSCNLRICKECLCEYVKYSNESNELPSCPCGSIFPYTNILEICQSDERYKYNSIILKEATRSVKNFDKHCNVDREIILNNFRREKQNFMKILPRGFSFVAAVALKDKMKRLEKEIIQTITYKPVHCRKMLCAGYLGKNGQCATCLSIFCVSCEIEICGDHVCSDEDIRTVQLVKQMVSCPSCDVKIEKSFGCNFLTCSICKTNFNYSTGEISTIGSDNPQHTDVIPRKKLYDVVPMEECEDILREIGNSEPKQYKLKHHHLHVDAKVLGKLFGRQHESFQKAKHYFALIRQIETAYHEGKLTRNVLCKIWPRKC